MAINYSLTQRQNPQNAEEKKVYAHAQYTTKMSLSEFSDHISRHGSVFQRDCVEGVLLATVSCLKELLLSGAKISLGDLGDFYVSIRSNGTDTAEEFTSKDITDVKVKWSMGKTFKTIAEDATFQYVGTRAAQQAARKAEKEAIDNGTTAEKDTEPGAQTGGDGDDDGEEEG